MIHLDLGQPGHDHDFRQHLRDSFLNSTDQTIRLRAGFAYATHGGIEELLDSLQGIPNWDAASKLWLIGVHHGITEPIAINMLAALPNSKVKLATCGLSLLRAIKGVRVFHAKIISVDIGATHDISTLIAGSANLTGAAIGHRTRNFEAGITWQSPVEVEIAQQFDSWWQDAWKLGTGASPKTISDYIEQRTGFLYRNPDILLDASPHGVDAVAEARVLWIEAGAMSTGGSHNAVDFNAELAKFFGPPSSETRLITITAGDRRWDDRTLSPKTTTFNVPLWRLSLPTMAKGGYDYSYRIVRLTKVEEGQDIEFNLEVADEGSPVAREWRIETERYGSIGRTGGGHSYGFR